MLGQVALRTGTTILGVLVLGFQVAAQEEIRPFSERIYGCKKTRIEEHPWQVAFNVKFPDGETYLCGGSLVAEKWVLTAAHCFHKKSEASHGRAKSGQTNIMSGAWGAIDRIVPHKEYTGKAPYEHDIALVKLRGVPKGKLIPMAGRELSISLAEPLEVSGWGQTEKGTFSADLCKTTVPYVSNSTCNEKAAYDGILGPGVLCAGDQKGKKDSCGGDSGGPLVSYSSGGPILVGVVSWGDGCAKKNKYGIYTRVSAYRDWIEGILAQD